MRHNPLRHSILLFVMLVLGVGSAWADQQLEQRASWQPASVAEVRQRVYDYLSTMDPLDETTQIQIDALWPEDSAAMSGDQLQQNVAATLAVVNPQAKEIVVFCRENRRRFELPTFDVLSDKEAAPFLQNNLRMVYGRWLAQQELYDEAKLMLQDLAPKDVADPASLLFYQSVTSHRLLEKENCLEQIEKTA